MKCHAIKSYDVSMVTLRSAVSPGTSFTACKTMSGGVLDTSAVQSAAVVVLDDFHRLHQACTCESACASAPVKFECGDSGNQGNYEDFRSSCFRRVDRSASAFTARSTRYDCGGLHRSRGLRCCCLGLSPSDRYRWSLLVVR